LRFRQQAIDCDDGDREEDDEESKEDDEESKGDDEESEQKREGLK
jgi:hypothetical protein